MLTVQSVQMLDKSKAICILSTQIIMPNIKSSSKRATEKVRKIGDMQRYVYKRSSTLISRYRTTRNKYYFVLTYGFPSECDIEGSHDGAGGRYFLCNIYTAALPHLGKTEKLY